MSENKINVSLKKCCICNNSKIGEFTIINGNKYHLCCIEELQQQLKYKDEKISKVREYCLIEKEDINGSKCDDILEILEEIKKEIKKTFYMDENDMNFEIAKVHIDTLFEILDKYKDISSLAFISKLVYKLNKAIPPLIS